MSQASRVSSSAGLSDDPIENFTTFLQLNARPIIIGVAAVALAAIGVYGYRTMDEGKREEANKALYQATAPMAQGKLPEAQAALEKVAQRYSGTASGTQALLLLGQVMFDQQKFGDGIKKLESGRGSASDDFQSSIEAMEAAGFEAQGKFAEAAEHYAKAASAAKFPLDKATNQASQARSLTAAGKPADAKKIWEELAKMENLPFAQEAQVRLGELAASAK